MRLAAKIAPVALACMLVLAAPAQASFPGRNGVIAFSSFRHGTYDIYTVSTTGTLKRITRTGDINETSPAWSADGRKIAYSRRDFSDQNHPGPAEVWVMNSDGTNRRRLGRGGEPAWSPDGKRIAFVGPRQRPNRPDVWVMNSDGGNRKKITSGHLSERSPDWSPDGKWIAYATDEGNSHDIWKVHPNGTKARRLTAVGPFDDQPSWSPDGRKIAYISRSRPGQYYLWTMRADGSQPAQVGDVAPLNTAWSPDGTQIAYEQSDIRGAALDVFTIPLTGLQAVDLTPSTAPDTEPSWQPR